MGPKERRTREREETKSRILDAAREMFVQDARLVLAQAGHAGRVGERLRQGAR